MTMPFVATLRARKQGIRVGPAGVPTITVRVEIPELWDVVRIEVPPTESVLAVKVAALGALNPRADQRHYVMKLRGFEMLDEQLSLADAGAIDGSIFLLTHRRRRPVR
jgi:hypothetical protein